MSNFLAAARLFRKTDMAIEIDDRLLQFIHSHRIAHLATADASLGPLVVPVCFVFDGESFFTPIDQKRKSVSASALRRVQNIRENPRVALLFDDYSEDWDALSYLLIDGHAKILDPRTEAGMAHKAVIDLLRSKYPQYRSMDIDQNLLIQVEPRRVKFWSAR
jgi:PPOX class probable F420-dependent enzyme